MGTGDEDFITALLHTNADVDEAPGKRFGIVPVETRNHALESSREEQI